MSEIVGPLATAAAVATVIGVTTGWLVVRSRTPLQRVAATLGMLLCGSVVSVCMGWVAARPPRFAPVQFVIGALTVAPMVIAAAGVSLVAMWLRASRSMQLITSALASAL